MRSMISCLIPRQHPCLPLPRAHEAVPVGTLGRMVPALPPLTAPHGRGRHRSGSGHGLQRRVGRVLVHAGVDVGPGAVAGPRDISELLAQALEGYPRTAAESDGAAPEGADAGELIAQALAAVAPRAEGAKEKPSEAVSSGGQDAGRGVPEAQTPAEGGGVVEPSGRHATGEGVED